MDNKMLPSNLSHLTEPMQETRKIAARQLAQLSDRTLSNPAPSSRAPGRTIDKSTMDQRDLAAYQQIRRFCSECEVEITCIPDIPWDRFTDWFFCLSVRVASSTYRKYRNDMVDYLEPYSETPEIRECMARLTSQNPYERDSQIDVVHLQNLFGSPHIIKYFPYGDFVILQNYLLLKSKSPYRLELAALLRAAITTGLRPWEFRGARIVVQKDPADPLADSPYLFALTAKGTNDRANFAIRAIDLTGLPTDLTLDIEACISRGFELELRGVFPEEFRDKFARLMCSTVRRIWKDNPHKMYSLYSCRHQACANWKSVYGPAEVAALMGHALTSAQRVYAPASAAWSMENLSHIVRPTAAEVRRVIEREEVVRDAELRLEVFRQPRPSFTVR